VAVGVGLHDVVREWSRASQCCTGIEFGCQKIGSDP
jgi:hypothetical protein